MRMLFVLRFLWVIKSILARDDVFPFYGQSLPVLWGLLSRLACPAEGYVRKDCPDSHILTFRKASQDLQYRHCSQFNSLTTSSFKVSEVQNRGRPKVKSVTCSHYAKELLWLMPVDKNTRAGKRKKHLSRLRFCLRLGNMTVELHDIIKTDIAIFK